MDTPFHQFKRQASVFFKEKIKTARLALTDVTPAQLLTEEATDEDSWVPDSRTMGLISRAAFEVDDYWRIVDILHKRLWKFDKKKWRGSYKGLILLEHLLSHGPERVAEEFQCDTDIIRKMASFHYVDDKGFNWGMSVRKKCERILKLVEERPFLKEERERARKLTSGIKGFGSFYQRPNGSFKESYVRCNSHYNYNNTIDSQNDVQKDEYLESKNPNTVLSTGDRCTLMESDYHPFCNQDHQTTGTSLLSTMG